MTTLSQQQVIQLAQQAGFSGSGLQSIVAIAHCESGFNTMAQNTIGNTPQGSMDRGILQFNGYWHKDVPDSCAYDPACAFQQAFRVSQGGTNFSQWATYRGNCYNQYLSGVPSNTTATSSTTSTGGGTALGSIPVIGGALDALVPSFINLMQEIGVFFIAVVIVVIGAILLWGDQIKGVASKV